MSKKSTTTKPDTKSTQNKRASKTLKKSLPLVGEAPDVRPPVVTVMGHVDHGKTSLLDKIRQTSIQAKEAGGITQSIGAYQVEKDGGLITFIDTPGHEAFTAMRARGGRAADIVILVVAANEGVKPQTVESIGHAQAAGVPIIVAINKIDMSNADPMRVKQQLTKHEIITEDLGGDTVVVEVSATTGQGIDQLLEMVQLVSEMQALESHPDRDAHGVVLEGRQDPQKGTVATLLVKEGTLSHGDIIATPSTWGKIRRMTDWKGNVVDQVYPAGPVEVMGLQEVPHAGELFEVAASEKEAKDKSLQLEIEAIAPVAVDTEGIKVVPLIIKADTKGALEAFRGALESLNTDESKVQIVHAGLSDVTEADVMLGTVSHAIILGFNVRVDRAAVNASQMERVPIMTYDIIYRALEDVQDFLESEADQLRAIGEARVKEVFELSNGTFVAGSEIVEGHVVVGAKAEVWRGEECIAEGRVSSLRHAKDKRTKISEGEECGIILNIVVEYAPKDTILFYPS